MHLDILLKLHDFGCLSAKHSLGNLNRRLLLHDDILGRFLARTDRLKEARDALQRRDGSFVLRLQVGFGALGG